MPPTRPDQLITLPAPHGFEGGPDNPDPTRGLVSLVFLPRLGDRGTNLSAWPGWSVWPRELSGLPPTSQPPLRFFVYVNERPFSIIVEDFRPQQVIWWTAVFPDASEVPVGPFAFRNPAAGTGIDSYPQAEASSTLAQLTQAIRDNHPDARPTVGELRASAGALLDQLPVEEARAYTSPRPEVSGVDTSLEFHQALAQLRRHPVLCRRLGLTVELVLALTPLRNSPDLPQDGSPWELQISTDWSSSGRLPGREEAAPKVLVDPATWRPAPKDPTGLIRLGQLNLQDDAFRIASGGTTTSVLRMADLDRIDDDQPAPLPTPPANPGISLYHADRASAVEDRFARQGDIEASLDFRAYNPDVRPETDVVLTAEDIGVAYRVDVSEVLPGGVETEPRSLHEREAPDGYYTANSSLATPPLPPPPSDEGWMGTVLADADGAVAPRLPEQLVLWMGWSMAAPLLGTVHDTGTGLPVPRQENRPEPDSPIQFGVDYEVPDGTLPKLRYGPTYKMRVRVVDIAGNSVPRVGEVTPLFSDPIAYLRLDPVAPPDVLRRAPREQPAVPGAETLTIVLRSDIDQDDATVPQQDRVLFPPTKDPRDWVLVEEPEDLHQPAGYNRLVGLDAKRLGDVLLADPVTGEAIAATQSGGTVVPGPVAPVADYLRDPAVSGIAYRDLPGGKTDVLVPYFPATPDPKELRFNAQQLIVAAGDGPPQVVTGEKTNVRIEVPKACITTIRVASTITPALADRFAAAADFESAVIESGGSWETSPPLTISLVHAIPNGRFDPTMPESGTGSRDAIDDTTGVVRVEMGMDVPATGQVTLRGRWEDPVDDPSQPAPGTVVRRAVLGTDDITYTKDGVQQTAGVRYEFGDAIRHVLQVQGLAIARFTPHFVEPHPVSFSGGDELLLEPTGVVGATFSLRSADGRRMYREGVDYLLDAAAGTIRRKPSGPIGANQPLSARYAPGPNTRSTLDGASPTTTVLVPNATVPPTPLITAVQPAHRRQQRRRWGAQLHRVDGRILRLRLARPWLVTGAGEQLAVVVDTAGGGIPTTTRFARDPITASEGPVPPNVTAFPAAGLTEADIAAVMPDGSVIDVDVAGHTPVFDEDRGDWVVDVQVAAAQYRPTIRLAVARYQPDSIDAAKLSAVTLLDSFRLGVSRTIAVARSAAGSAAAPVLSVTVTGVDHDGRLDAVGAIAFNSVVVTVQEADTTISDPDLRWRSTGTAVELARSAGLSETTWSGDVPLPPAVGPLRLVVEEFEPAVRDDGTGAGGVDALDLVLVETIPVPEGVVGGR